MPTTLSAPKAHLRTCKFSAFEFGVPSARPAQYTVAIRSRRLVFYLSFLCSFLFHAIPLTRAKTTPMATAEPDKTLDLTPPSPNSTVPLTAPPEPSPAKPADATPNGTSAQAAVVVPQVNVNGEPLRSPRPSGTFATSFDPDSSTWGANFWVTLVDPQVRHPRPPRHW